MFSAAEIFDIAVQIEKNGENFYRKAAATASDPTLRKLLLWLADAEVQHRETFLELKATLSQREEDLWIAEMSGTFLRNAVDDHAFSLDDIDFNSVHDKQSLIRIALELEHDSITFYELVSSFVDDPQTLQHLQRIIAEEREHIELLEQRRQSLRPATENVNSSA